MIPVVETFGPTVQGEGPNAGARCIFVRVKGCDFCCDFCDSKFTWKNSDVEAEEYTEELLVSKLMHMCKSTSCYQVVLTGGNPCLYDFARVVSVLIVNNIKVDVETQGSLFPKWLSMIDTIVFSPKPPSSKMPDTYNDITKYIQERIDFSNHGQTIAIKIPVFNDEDIEFARNYAQFVQVFNRIYDSQIKMYLSVGNSDTDTTESIRDRVLTDYESLLNKINNNPEYFENVFILPQIHTLVWGNKQGV